MSSTNVHSKNDNLHICGGQTIPQEPDEELKMPPQASGRGPAKIEVIEGEKAVITAQPNIVVKDGKTVVGRATEDGQVLSGDAAQVKRALNADKERD